MIFSLFQPIINKNLLCCIFYPYAACMQQYAATVVFLCIWIIVALFNYKMFQIMIFSTFDGISNEKSNMLQFWPVCSNYAATCCSSGFFEYYG